MRKPSSVSRRISIRARAASPSGALVEQQAGRTRRAAPDPAAQLVQLREAEALGVLDHHDRRLGHVDADLDHGGGDQHLASRRAGTAPSPRPCPRPSCGRGSRPTAAPKNARSASARSSRGGDVERLALLDQRADPIGARARRRSRGRSPATTSVEPLERDARGCRSACGRAASRRARRRPCRRNRSAPACAGSASRSSPAGRPPRPWPRARAADARRSDAARRRPRGRDRGTRRSPETARACRRRCRSRRPRAPPALRARSAAVSRPVSSASRRPRPRRAARIRSKCWRARISVGAISAACRPPRRRRPSRAARRPSCPSRRRPAAAAACAFRRARSARISASARVCAPVSAKGQGGHDFAPSAPSRDIARVRRGSRIRARTSQQRELVGEQFVEGEPRQRRRCRARCRRALRAVHRAQRRGESRRAQALRGRVGDPFGQPRHARERALARPSARRAETGPR